MGWPYLAYKLSDLTNTFIWIWFVKKLVKLKGVLLKCKQTFTGILWLNWTRKITSVKPYLLRKCSNLTNNFTFSIFQFEHRALRLRGYIEFYVKTKNIRRTPFYIISSFNAILLVTAVALEDYCDNNDEDPGCQAKETKIEVLRGLIVLEGLSVASMWLKYVMDHRKFTKEKSCPDMWREDFREKVLKPRLTSTPSEESESRQVYPERPPTQEYIMELQAELLVLLCPDIGQTEDLRQRITNYVRPITRWFTFLRKSNELYF